MGNIISKPYDFVPITSVRHFEQLCASVHFADPATVYVERSAAYVETLQFGAGSVIYPHIYITGPLVIGAGSVLGPSVMIGHCTIGNGTVIEFSKLEYARIGAGVHIGPFALIEYSFVGDESEIGFTAQIKRSQLGDRTVAKHHCYLGDSKTGIGVNVGAGAISGNFGGQRKNDTIIEDGAFIGINVNLIAPVTIGREAYIGAGAIIKKNVPPHAVVVGMRRILKGRKSMRVPEGWVIKKE